ncbi:MAG TPA: L,D-transpeptidase [Polyangiaceae bacterium]
MPIRRMRSDTPAAPGVFARLVLMLAALSLTSCPHQARSLRRARGGATKAVRPTHREVRRLVSDTAARAERLTGPQIPAPPYVTPGEPIVPADDPGTAPPADPVESESATLPNPSEAAVTSGAAPASNLPERLNELPEQLIYSIGRETQIYAAPKFDARRIGYLRYGAEVRRTTEAVSHRNCAGGWFGIKPSGFVCVNGRAATSDANHPLVQARIARPERMDALPYAYTLARHGVPRLFSYAPGPGEFLSNSAARRLAQIDHLRTMPLPDEWRRPREVFGYERPRDKASLGNGLPGSGLALVGFYTDAGRLYGVTPDLELVSTDALEPVTPSHFAGKALGASDTLPVAFAMKSAWAFQGDPRRGAPKPIRQLARREAVFLNDEHVNAQRIEWRQMRDGNWVHAADLRIVEARTEWPDWAKAGHVWVDVSIQLQSLVAYEGNRPAYVTLVSTGVDGLNDPATTKSTKTGVFHIVSKHLTATMNSDDSEDAYEMREVPWVQYFSEGYALHGAYWHDAFGQPRSHGCVNLSPLDARWLFHFTSPGVPKNWHGAIPSEGSATVYVHP